MNLVYISPNFPPNFYNFAVKAAFTGIKVHIITDCERHDLNQKLNRCITSHYKVNSFNNIQEMINACDHFISNHGPIDYIESNIEVWLETEAELRSIFNIKGPKKENIEKYIRKSLMKEEFNKAGILTSPGCILKDITTLTNFINKYDLPVIIKPDRGVGAGDTYKIIKESDIEKVYNSIKHDGTIYFIEKYIDGHIETYDGLRDLNGKTVFSSSLKYSGTLEMKNSAKYYYLQKDIPEDILSSGEKVLDQFDIKGRFFHLEFFRTTENKLIGLELNMRPPGGFSMDMMNFSCNIDLYLEWANILRYNKFYSNITEKFFIGFIGREDWISYNNSDQDIIYKYKDKILLSQRMPDVFADLMGNHAYLFRTSTKKELFEILDFIRLSQ